MSKFRPFSRRELRRLRTSWLRRNAGMIAFLLGSWSVMAALVTLVLAATLTGAFKWYVLGALHTGLVAIALHTLNSAFLALDREALWHVRGAWGEENTRSELQRARRRRLIWGWVDSIDLRAGDLDHVVVTRRGGLVALDSKWRNAVTADETAAMARSARKVQIRAEGVARTVLQGDRRARHRARGNALPVTPVVVLWGAAQHSVPDGAVIEGVRFVAGRQLVAWLRSLDGDPVTKDAAADVLERLKSYRASASQQDRGGAPALSRPPTPHAARAAAAAPRGGRPGTGPQPRGASR